MSSAIALRTGVRTEKPAGATLDLKRFSELLLHVERGVTQPAHWDKFLELLAQDLRASVTGLVLRPVTVGETGLMHLWGASAEGFAAYAHRYFALDPFVQLPLGRVVTLDQVVPADVLERSEFYRDYLVPYDAIYHLGVDLRAGGLYRVRFRACRPRHAGPFGPHDRALCELLVPHLQTAVDAYAEFELMSTECSVYAQAMDHLTMATLILDHEGRVIHGNGAAHEILAQHDGIILDDNHLTLPHREDAELFHAAFKRALAGRRAGQPSIVEVVRIHRSADQEPIVVVVKPAAASHSSAGDRTMLGAVAVFLSTERGITESTAAGIQKLLGLTNKETQLALCLANGRSLQESAADIGITLSTARAHLRAIFAKTGIDRQSRLVRVILRSVAALGA
jgi:DNA-binding CsgD family transcriptional regulator